MLNRTDRLVVTGSLIGLLTLGLGLAGEAFLFSVGVSILICFALVAPYGSHASHPKVAIPLFVTLLGLWMLFAGAFQSHRPDEPLQLVLGLPIGSFFFLFGIWPLGLLPPILLTILFKRFILPKKNVKDLVTRFGRWNPNS